MCIAVLVYLSYVEFSRGFLEEDLSVVKETSYPHEAMRASGVSTWIMAWRWINN